MDKDSLFSIGDVAKMFHLSVGSMRHYETLGILIPEYVDPQTNYRYYSPRQFEILNTVRYLRALDMPLPQIADFLKDRDIDVIEDKLLNQKQQVIQKKKELEIIERKIDNRLHQIRDARDSELNVIKIFTAPPCRLVRINDSLRLKNQTDIEKTVSKLSANEDEPMVFLGKVGVGISKENLCAQRYEKYDYAFLVLDDEDKYSAEVECMTEALCVSIRFCGVHSDAPFYYRRLADYIKNNGLRISGFSREITMIDYGITSDTKKFVAEIDIPVIKKENF